MVFYDSLAEYRNFNKVLSLTFTGVLSLEHTEDLLKENRLESNLFLVDWETTLRHD